MRSPSRTTSTKADDFRRIEVITGVGRRRRWTDEEKAWIVAESLDPATTVSAVARRYGLHASQLAESGVRRNILGRCGNALAGDGNLGWGDGGRDASEAGGAGAGCGFAG
jgi:hypothetical protein